MNLVLMRCTDEKNKVNKNPVPVKTAQGTLKNTTSLTDPVIRLSGLTALVAAECNYMDIPDFNRKYFVTDIKNVSNDIWEFTCHVDVLYSFATEIKDQTAIIERQENRFNLYLDDEEFKVYQNPYVVTKAFPGGFRTLNFVLAMAGS